MHRINKTIHPPNAIKGLRRMTSAICFLDVGWKGSAIGWAFAAALSAFYEQIPVGHVEAGLRTDNLLDPFPEEANRRLISQIAHLHFAPTKQSKANLQASGVVGRVLLTGNTVIDALLRMSI